MGRAYKLPEGNIQISFSGGRTSAFMLHKILESMVTYLTELKLFLQTQAKR